MKNILILIIFAFLFQISEAQYTVNDGTYIKHIVKKRRPVNLQYIREADVLWSKVVWRKIVLTEKANLPLYYPTVPMPDRKSFIQLIMHGIKNNSIMPYASDDFETYFTMSEVEMRFGASLDTMYQTDEETGEQVPVIIPIRPRYEEVQELLVKEMWIFDKQRSVMDVRIIGIAIIRVYDKDYGGLYSVKNRKIAFWVLFKEARNLFAEQNFYSGLNQSTTINFEDVFLKRKFSSYIAQESNIFENRPIIEYESGLASMLESEKIANKIFDYEHDMWEF